MTCAAPQSILFACTMNAVRSPMAAALLRHFSENKYYVRSAGVKVGSLDPFSVAIMSEIDIDISQHTPKTLSELGDNSFDTIITLTPEAHHQAIEFTRTMYVQVIYWPTLDPSLTSGNREQMLSAYRACRDGLLSKIRQYFQL